MSRFKELSDMANCFLGLFESIFHSGALPYGKSASPFLRIQTICPDACKSKTLRLTGTFCSHHNVKHEVVASFLRQLCATEEFILIEKIILKNPLFILLPKLQIIKGEF